MDVWKWRKYHTYSISLSNRGSKNAHIFVRDTKDLKRIPYIGNFAQSNIDIVLLYHQMGIEIEYDILMMNSSRIQHMCDIID